MRWERGGRRKFSDKQIDKIAALPDRDWEGDP